MIFKHSSENMPELKAESVQLVVTSPPYPMIAKWDDLYRIVDFDIQHSMLLPVWEECYRVLSQGGILCINIGDATRTIDRIYQCYPNYARLVMDCRQIGFLALVPVLWRKISNRPNAFLGSGFLPPNAYIAQDCEYIAIFRKGKLRSFPPKDKNRLASSYTKKERDLWFQQVWNICGARGARTTSAFPEEIPYRLIRMFSIVGDLVLDPFLGTGTVGRVAARLGRRFVGYEVRRRTGQENP